MIRMTTFLVVAFVLSASVGAQDADEPADAPAPRDDAEEDADDPEEDAVRPDVVVENTLADWQQGVDRVFEAALAYQP